MFGAEILEVAIGLLFVYLLCTLVCSSIKEWISRLFDLRARDLEKRIIHLLEDPELAKKIYAHPLVKGITRRTVLDKVLTAIVPWVQRYGKPSYINVKTFAAALGDILIKAGEKNAGTQKKEPFENLEIGINTLVEKKGPDREKEKIYNALKSIVETVKTDVAKVENRLKHVRASIEEWFDNSMDRMSIWYKQKSRIIIFVIALVLSSILNIDTLMIAKKMYHDESVRVSVVALAEKPYQKPRPEGSPAAPTEEAKELKSQLAQMNLPIGWVLEKTINQDPRGKPTGFLSWLFKCLGLLITALAISMGAPFCMDILKQTIKLRKGKITSKKEN